MSKIREATVVTIVDAREAQKQQQAREMEAYITSLSPVHRQIFFACSLGNTSINVSAKDIDIPVLQRDGYTVQMIDTDRLQISW